MIYDANGNFVGGLTVGADGKLRDKNGRVLIRGADGCLYDEDGNMIYDANGNLVKRIPWLPAFALIKCTDNYDTGGYEETARQDHYEGPAWKGIGPPGYFDPMQERRGLGPDGASADAKGGSTIPSNVRHSHMNAMSEPSGLGPDGASADAKGGATIPSNVRYSHMNAMSEPSGLGPDGASAGAEGSAANQSNVTIPHMDVNWTPLEHEELWKPKHVREKVVAEPTITEEVKATDFTMELPKGKPAPPEGKPFGRCLSARPRPMVAQQKKSENAPVNDSATIGLMLDAKRSAQPVPPTEDAPRLRRPDRSAPPKRPGEKAAAPTTRGLERHDVILPAIGLIARAAVRRRIPPVAKGDALELPRLPETHTRGASDTRMKSARIDLINAGDERATVPQVVPRNDPPKVPSKKAPPIGSGIAKAPKKANPKLTPYELRKKDQDRNARGVAKVNAPCAMKAKPQRQGFKPSAKEERSCDLDDMDGPLPRIEQPKHRGGVNFVHRENAPRFDHFPPIEASQGNGRKKAPRTAQSRRGMRAAKAAMRRLKHIRRMRRKKAAEPAVEIEVIHDAST